MLGETDAPPIFECSVKFEAMNASKRAGSKEKPQSKSTTSPGRDTCGLVHEPMAINDAMKIPDGKAAVDKDWETWKHLLASDLKKVEPKSEMIQQAKKDGRLVHFAHLTDLCYLKRS